MTGEPTRSLFEILPKSFLVFGMKRERETMEQSLLITSLRNVTDTRCRKQKLFSTFLSNRSIVLGLIETFTSLFENSLYSFPPLKKIIAKENRIKRERNLINEIIIDLK